MYSAERAAERFRQYEEYRSEFDYHYAVSELNSFCNAYHYLVVETEGSTDTNFVWLNQLVGELMDYPELTQEQIVLLASAMDTLSGNISDDNAYDDIFAVYNELVR